MKAAGIKGHRVLQATFEIEAFKKVVWTTRPPKPFPVKSVPEDEYREDKIGRSIWLAH